MKTLVAGWFSFPLMGATAGDLLVRDVVCGWLEEVGRRYDVATAPPFPGGVDQAAIDPRAYDEIVFVCGPFGNGPPVDAFLARFAHCRKIGIDLSMLQPLDEWNPFDLLVERDSTVASNPDLSLLAKSRRVPVVGRCLVEVSNEYRERSRHALANAGIDRLLARNEAAVVPIDTRLDENLTGLRTPSEVESLIASMQVIVTTRLHGTVLALKNGVPVLPVDPVAGGAKIAAQVRTLGWPILVTADQIDDTAMQRAYEWCLTAEARSEASRCSQRAVTRLLELRQRVLAALRQMGDAPPRRP